MGERRRITAALAALLALAASSACKREAKPSPSPAPSAAESAKAPPVDQLLPGELAPGSDQAFGLPIPRRMRTVARFPDAVFAEGEVSVEDVAGYVKKRVVAEGVEAGPANAAAGPAKVVFTRATLKDAPARVVRVEVIARGGVTALVVRDETRPPAKDGLTEEQRWKELGLTPQGQPLDPTKLE